MLAMWSKSDGKFELLREVNMDENAAAEDDQEEEEEEMSDG